MNVRIGTALCAALVSVTTGVAASSEGRETGGSAIVRSPRTEVQLVAEELTVRPGEPFRVGLRFEMVEGWHVYWKNPGDSGTAPAVTWSLPPGWRAGEIEWPYPARLPVGPFVNFGYEGEILLPVPLEPSGTAPAADSRPLRIEAEASWLVCKEDCIPERGSFVLDLPLGDGPLEPTRWLELFAATDERLPVALAGVEATVTDAGDGTLRVAVTHPPELELDEAEIEFFPATPATVEHSAAARIEAAGRRVTLELERSPFAAGEVTELEGVLVARPRTPHGSGAIALDVHATTAGEAAAPAAADLGVGTAMGLAFLGGLLLNLMPCVFPVISIKILSLLEDGQDREAGRRCGLLFAAGIVVSFWILAGLLLALRAAGQAVGWGFQLQSPLVLGLLALLFFSLGLSFLGVFEIGTALGGRVASFHQRGGAGGAFLGGMLATLVATPCTAPFMGSAIGFAVVVAPHVAWLVFTALGLGMAAPYAALALSPGALHLLPRPGRWMETLKQLMAFPLFATVLWLLWVLSSQRGSEGVLAVLGALLLAGFAAWVVGRFSGASAWRRSVALGTGALAAAGAIWLVVPGGDEPGPSAREMLVETDGIEWIAWSPEVVERLRAEGRAVWVDFTARWCLTCQVNKRVVFGSADVRRSLAQRDVALVRADWTSQDPRITEALASFGRSGVPLNVYYPPGPDSEPRVLPALLKPSTVLDTIRAL